MLDGFTFEQLRTFIAAVDAGSAAMSGAWSFGGRFTDLLQRGLTRGATLARCYLLRTY